MKKPKKFKRFGAGGGPLGDESIMTDEEYAKQKEQGAKNWESLKNFFGGRRSADEPSAPIENRQPPKVEKAEPAKTEPAKTEPAKSERVEKPSFTVTDTTPKERGETDFNYETQKPYNQALEDAKEQGRRARDAFKPAKPAAAKSEKDVKYSGNAINVSSGASGFKFPDKSSAKTKSAGPEDIPGTDVKTPYKGETIDNSNLPAKQFAQSMLGASPALRGVGAGVRGAMGLGRMFESAPKAEGKGTGKFPEEKPEITVPRTPAVERKAKVEGPPASAAAPKPKTPAEQMGVRETESMRRAREAKEQFEAAGKSAKEAADKSSKNASDEVAAEAAKRAASKRQTPDNRRFPNKGSATPGRPRASGEFRATNNKFDRPVGEKRGPKTDEVLEREGLPIKKGGKIPAFKKGGLVGRADGCAQRGKTKGRMV